MSTPLSDPYVTAHADILAAMRDMLGPQFGVAVSDPQAPEGPLWPEEIPAMARAIPKRVNEFTAGRDAARAAMDNLGLAPTAIPQGADRAPVWPDGVIGSIAHCDHICIAAVGHSKDYASLGLDIEPATPLEANLIDTICTSAEQSWLHLQKDPGLAAKMIFSAKEAVYKAQYTLTRKIIGFEAVEVTLSPEQGLFMAQLSPDIGHEITQISGAWRQVGAYFLTTCKL